MISRDLIRRFKGITLLSLVLSLVTIVRLNVILPSYIVSLGGDFLLVGAIYSAASIFRSVARLLSGLGAERLGNKRIIELSLLVRMAAFTLLYVARDVVLLSLGYVLIAMAEGLESPVFLSTTALAFGETEIVATAFGIAISARHAPGIAAPMITGYVADNAGPHAVFILGLAASLLALAAASRIEIAGRSPENREGFFRGVNSILDRRFLLLLLTSVLLFQTVSAFRPLFSYWMVEEVGISYTALGAVLSIESLMALASRIYTGVLSDRLGHVRVLSIIGLVRSAIYFAFTATLDPLLIASLYVLRGVLVAAPSRNALVSKLAKEHYTIAYSIIGLAIDLGRITGPMIAGLVASMFGTEAGFTAIALISLAYGLAILTLRQLDRR